MLADQSWNASRHLSGLLPNSPQATPLQCLWFLQVLPAPSGMPAVLLANIRLAAFRLPHVQGLVEVHDKMKRCLAAEDAYVDGILVACDVDQRWTKRRKPGPGMLEEAMTHFGVRWAMCAMCRAAATVEL